MILETPSWHMSFCPMPLLPLCSLLRGLLLRSDCRAFRRAIAGRKLEWRNESGVLESSRCCALLFVGSCVIASCLASCAAATRFVPPRVHPQWSGHAARRLVWRRPSAHATWFVLRCTTDFRQATTETLHCSNARRPDVAALRPRQPHATTAAPTACTLLHPPRRSPWCPCMLGHSSFR